LAAYIADRVFQASNMNFGLMLSVKLEEKLAQVVRDDAWSQQDEDREYDRCLLQVMSELPCRPLAGGNIRVGDYILLGTSNFQRARD